MIIHIILCLLVLQHAVVSSMDNTTVGQRSNPWRAHKNTARLRHSRHLLDRTVHGPYVESYRDENPVISDSTLRVSRVTPQENHKPIFSNCSKYQPTVKEEEGSGTFVFQVNAADRDPPDNGGTVTYTFVSRPGDRLRFHIDPVTGNITTKHVFDRDEPNREKEVYLTVRATDNGRPQLDDVCTIKVIIEDINDNTPVFDKVNYQESVPQDLLPGKQVMRLSATDTDDGNNSIVVYDLKPIGSRDENYFRINRNTGAVFLEKKIDQQPGYKFRLQVNATDKGDPPLSTVMDLDIIVVESNKKAPMFTAVPASPIVLLENLTDFSHNIATLSAISNTDEKAPVFELVPGRTEQTNKLSTFRLESEGNTAHIRLARHMDYESIADYTLTIRIKNKYNLAAQQSINIQLEDVNDNIPTFTEVVSGRVLENEPPGTPVMQVRAIDADSTAAHNQVTYELADNQDNFVIDRYTGNITTLKMFDREEQDFYNVKVIATDNSPSALYTTGEHNKGQQVFRIEIADKNDHPPKFTQPVYIAQAIPEDSNNNALVIEVKALDNDTASPVSYSIIEGNENDTFLIGDKTGEIRVKKQLDYETLTAYTLKVRAYDGAFEDFCRVEIKIKNINDNPPKFEIYENTISIVEEELVPGCIIELEAYDPDIQDRSMPQHIVYSVMKKDQQKLLTIDKNGCLSLIKPLDRDPPSGFETWQVLILANDNDGNAVTEQQTTEVLIALEDINDNAPFLDMVQPVVWRENQPPGIITTLIAKDNDSPKNGGPFKFSISSKASPDIRNKFSITGTDLRALDTFDREERKTYMVPIDIQDSGQPPMTGTSVLHIVIGDKNDNPMKEGQSNIFVYNYKGEAPDTEIGRVYVEDPDDWDLPDKHFTWIDGPHPNFDLNSRTGMITMLGGTMDQTYILHFKVTEESTEFAKHSVNALVNVTVKVIPEEAVDKSGSIRFSGITAEEFVNPDSNGVNKQSILRKKLAKYFNISEDNVDVFTVLHSPHNLNSSQLDVRFSAHGSPYYLPEKLNAEVSIHKDELEQELGVSMLMINIDECLLEKHYCEEASCTNFLNKINVPSAVYTNTTSFVGVNAVVDPLCSCELGRKFVCHNGGTQVGNKCECLEGFDGPQCEIVSVGFFGDGWALYPTIEACADSHLSLELRPNKPNGLVFYVGPTSLNNALHVQDFMSLEIQNGYPVLLVDFGSGTVRIEQTQIPLNDGQQHRIDIFWTKTSIELQVDNCKLPACLKLTLPAGPNEFLNVNGPLQIGGSFIDLSYIGNHMNWTFKPTNEGFSGCVRNFTFNGKLYNLGMPSRLKNIDLGCTSNTLAVAVTFGIDTSFLVAILICVAILIILLLAVVVHRHKTDDLYKDTDDIRENIISYEDEGGGEGDMGGTDLHVLRLMYEDPMLDKYQPDHLVQKTGRCDHVPDICGFLDGKKQSVDNDPETNPFDDVRHYAYEGDGNTTGSLSSLASGTDEGDLNFDYLSNFGPRFRKLADMYGEDPSDEEDDQYQHTASESWC